MHVLHTFANNDHVPYLTWFTDRAVKEGSPRYSFLILYPERPGILDEMHLKGFQCEWIRYRDSHRKLDMFLALPKLWQYMRKWKPDIVHCNLFDDSLPGLFAALLARIQARVVTKQDTGYHYMHAPKWMFMDRMISRMATDVIAISNESKAFLIEKEGTNASKISLVHNGIPADRFTKQDVTVMKRLQERFGIAGHGPVFGTVARFIEWKGYKFVVDAARIIVKDHPNARFLFCGTGDQQPEIASLVHQFGLSENVVFTGWVERSEMASFYGLLDVYLHAAVLEPFGLVFVEAMMNGVPVVSTSTGAARDAIITGENGILVEERSGAALANGVAQLFSSDPKLIGNAGKGTAMRMYVFDRMWHGTIDLYERAMKQR